MLCKIMWGVDEAISILADSAVFDQHLKLCKKCMLAYTSLNVYGCVYGAILCMKFSVRTYAHRQCVYFP